MRVGNGQDIRLHLLHETREKTPQSAKNQSRRAISDRSPLSAELSRYAKESGQFPEVRDARVAEVKERLANGKYSGEEIVGQTAAAIIESFSEAPKAVGE